MELNILIIDDHPPIIEGYKSILSFNTVGYLVVTTSAFDCESAYKIIANTSESVNFAIVFIDITLPPFPEKNLLSGEDLVPLVRKYLPQSKIVILTSHSEKFILFRILDQCKPEGLLLKNDITSEEFLNAFTTILNGENYFSESVKKHQFAFDTKDKKLDNYNRQIIILLSQGVKNKSIQDQLHLSRSAIDKRKVQIKQFLDIDKGTDEDIIREAKNLGLI